MKLEFESVVDFFFILLLVAIISVTGTVLAYADTTQSCQQIYNGNTTVAATISGNEIAFPNHARGIKFIATSSCVSCSASTLDIKLQRCRANSGTTNCTDMTDLTGAGIAFSQCGTSTCYTDGDQDIDLAQDLHETGYVRAVLTAAGTTPTYNAVVEMCVDK